MALGSTQPLREMSTKSTSWGKRGRCVGLTTLPPSCAVVMKSGNLNFLEPSGPPQVCNRTALLILTSILSFNLHTSPLYGHLTKECIVQCNFVLKTCLLIHLFFQSYICSFIHSLFHSH
jgi:hypothetical protein